MKEFIAGRNESGQRLDKYLKKILPNASMGFIYKMLRKKNIKLNDKKALGTEIVSLDDNIKIYLSDETFEKFSVDEESLKKDFNALGQLKLSGLVTVYEDDDILAASKPVNMLSQKAVPSDISANERLIGYLINEGSLTFEDFKSFKPSVCNRLDRNTSGLILMGKSLRGLQYLSKVLKDRTAEKYYLAAVDGVVDENMTIEGYLTKDEALNKVQITPEPVNDESLPVKTAYRPLETVEVTGGASYDKEVTLLEVHLITGRSHQIRAHLASIGHPIIGDMKYGDKKVNEFFKEKYGVKSQLLHAHHVVFPDGKHIEAKPPHIWNKLGFEFKELKI